MSQKIDRTGERKMMKCGMEAEIIEYKNRNDITVRFDDGTVVMHKRYREFCNGEIGHPDINFLSYRKNPPLATYHIGERRIMNCGMEAKIIEYNNSRDITVQFEDGVIVSGKRYGSFQHGAIAHPNCKIVTTSIGETALLYYLAPHGYQKAPKGSLKEYGMGRFEIDAFNQNEGIGIEYDGPWHQDSIERDAQKNDLFFQAFKRLIRIRDFRLSCNDKRVEYYQVDTCIALSKKYETTLRNVFHSLGLQIDVNFERDKDKIYNLYYKSSPRAKVGEKRRMYNGLMAEIIQYRSSTDIDVQFEDGAIKTTTYGQFVQGYVSHPNIHPRSRAKYKPMDKTKHIGERRVMNCGREAELIEYNSADDIAVRFGDDVIVRHKKYYSFCHGAIAHPNIDRKAYPKRQQATTA